MTDIRIKDPDAVEPFELNWESWLKGDTLSTSTWILPDGLVEARKAVSTTLTTIWLGGGSAGKRYEVLNRITTAGGLTEDRSFILLVAENAPMAAPAVEAQVYATVQELLDDLGEEGVKAWREGQALERIREASAWIAREMGNFIPVEEARTFDGPGGVDLWVDPLLEVDSVVDDEDVLASGDYFLKPANRLWKNGPYIRMRLNAGEGDVAGWSSGEDLIVVVGKWGLYQRCVALPATVATQLAGDVSLVVSNGGAISPGAVLLIDGEQELVTATGAPTDSTANLAEALDTEEEEVDVNDGSLVSIGEVVRVDFEQMRVRDRLGNTLLVSRGYNGTKRATHLTSTDVYVYRTFNVERAANGTGAGAHSSAVIYRYLVPEDVQWLARQMAGLMLKKAESGFAGKSGSMELGEVFYYQEFPKEAILRVRENYFVPVV